MDETDILVGFGFHPTDQEIIRILEEKRRDPSITVPAIFETNIYDFEPPELSGLSPIRSDKKWCSFFCAPNYINTDSDRKRVYRATKTGYWKLTGEGYPIKEKRSKRVIGFKRVLVFYERPGGSKEIKTNWVMHQFSATDNPLYKKDFVVCRVKKPGNKKRRTSTNVGRQQRKKRRVSTNCQGQPSHDMAFDNEKTSLELQLPIIDNTTPESPLSVIENTSSELQLPIVGNIYLELQLPVVENTYLELQLPIVENTYPKLQLPIVENTYPELQLPVVENTYPELQLPVVENTYPELQLPVVENTYPELQLPVVENTYPELQLPVVEDTYPELQLPVVENTYPELQLPSDCSIYDIGHDVAENTLQVDPPRLATFSALNGCIGLVRSSFSAVQSPINPEQEFSSSGVSTNDYNGLVSPPFSIVWEEDIPLNVQDEYTSEEGRGSTLHFKSSKSIPGFCGGDRSETDTEFTEWVHGMFEYNNIASVNYNAILNY